MNPEVPNAPVPFRERLKERIAEQNRSQAWLAEASEVSPSIVSRILSGEREATPDVIESLARGLGMEAAILADGTDASSRVLEAERWVKRETYAAVYGHLTAIEFERNTLIREQKADRESLRIVRAEADTCAAELRRARRELEESLAAKRVLTEDLEEYRKALQKAVEQVNMLNEAMATIKGEVATTNRSSKVAAALAAVAAAAGVVTVSHFLSKDDPVRKKAGKRKPKEKAR